MYRLTYRPSVSRYVGRHNGRVLVDMSTEMCWSMYRPMYQPRNRPSDGQHIDRLSADISADTLTIDCWRNISRPSVVYWSKA